MGQGEDPHGSAGAGTVHWDVGRDISGPEFPQCPCWGGQESCPASGGDAKSFKELQGARCYLGTSLLEPACEGLIWCHQQCPGAAPAGSSTKGCSTAEPRRQDNAGVPTQHCWHPKQGSTHGVQ